MAFKRKASTFKKAKKWVKKASSKKGRFTQVAASKLAKMVTARIHREAETKTTITNYSDGRQWTHMQLCDLDANPWSTSQGLTNPQGAANNSTYQANRIGDEVLAKGVRYKIFLQNNERFSEVHHRFIFVRCARGESVTAANFFMGRSDNKLIDDIDRAKMTVIYDRTFKIRSPPATTGAEIQSQDVTTLVGHGTYNNEAAPGVMSSQPGAKVITIYIPFSKDNKYKKLVYTTDGGGTPKFFDYHLLYMPYVLQNTSTTLNVSTFNDMSKVFYFKDP